MPWRTDPIRRRAVLVGLLLVVLTVPLRAQRLPIRSYTTDDGLPASQIWSVHQDRRGLMWFGTTQGVTRYDGQEFTTLTLADGLPDLLVRVIVETPDGSLWFGTNGGVAEYDGRRIRSFTEDDGLGKGPVWDATLDRYGHLWFATQDGGASLFDGRSFKNITTADGLLSDYVYSIHSDTSGAIWLGHRSEGLTRVVVGPGGELKDVRTFSTDDGMPKAGVRAITEDRYGNLYFGTRGGGVVRYDGKNRHAITSEQGLSGDDVYALLVSSHGELVVGTIDGGVSICDIPEMSRCRWVQERNGLSFDVVYSLGEDRDHILWVGLNNGLSKIVNERFVTITDQEGLASNAVHNVLPDGEDVWFGTVGGLSKLVETGNPREPFRIDNFTRGTALPSEGIWAVMKDSRGLLWIGTRSGLVRMRDAAHTRFTEEDGLVGDYISDLAEDSKGRLWIATSKGVSLMPEPSAEKPTFRNFTIDDGLSGSVAYAVAESSDGRIWIGTATNGVDVWDGRSFRNFDTENGLRSNTVNHVFEASDGTLWVGTSGGGVSRLDKPSEHFVSFGFEAGLPSDTVVSVIEEEGTGRLWMGTAAGIALFDPQMDGGKVVSTVTKRDGLAGNEVIMGGGLAYDEHGRLWVATTQGATRITGAGETHGERTAPPVMISRVEFGRERSFMAPFTSIQRGSATDFPLLTRDLAVPHDENRFKVEFRGLSFRDEKSVKYDYRLTGFDPGWSGETDVTFKEYTNLPPGDYVFEVRARSNSGSWTSPPAEYPFRIMPAFYQTIWARLGFLLLGGAAIAGAIRFRTLSVERRNRELQALVNSRTEELKGYSRRLERHARELQEANIGILEANRTKSRFLATMSHELRTPLNSIIGFSEILAQRIPGSVDEKDLVFLRNILDSGHHLLNLINNLLDLSKIEAGRMEVHAESIHLAEMISSVQSVLTGLATRRNVSIDTEIEAGIDTVMVDAPKFRQILYNLISNAIKFSPDGEPVRVEVKRVPREDSPIGLESFQVDVIDRGVGITPEEQRVIFEEFRQTTVGSVQPGGTGLGLAIVRKLVEIQGGSVSVWSDKGEGSRFTVLLPLEVEEAEATFIDTEGTGRRTILVVEDDPDFREMMQATLTEAGYDVICLTRGEDVIPIAEEVRPVVITLDVVLPGVDGWEVLKRLKANEVLASTPVVMVTASNSRELGLALGADDFFVKPLDQDRLVARIMSLAPPNGSFPRILVIDDDPNVISIVKASLGSSGYMVTGAESGPEGIETARTNRPSLIILDLMMPGMNGFEVAKVLQSTEETSQIPLVVLTARDLSLEERKELNGKISALLSKGSTNPAVLLQAVKRLEARIARD